MVAYQYIENNYDIKNAIHLLHEVNVDTRRIKDVFLTPYVNIECLSDLVAQISYIPKGTTIKPLEIQDISHHPDLSDNPGSNQDLTWKKYFRFEKLDDGLYYYYLNENLLPYGRVYLNIKFEPEYENDYAGEPNQRSLQLYTYLTDSNIYKTDETNLSLANNKIRFNINGDLNIGTTNYSSD